METRKPSVDFQKSNFAEPQRRQRRGRQRFYPCDLARIGAALLSRASTARSRSEQVREILAALIPPHATFIVGAERREGLLRLRTVIHSTASTIACSCWVRVPRFAAFTIRPIWSRLANMSRLRGVLTAVGMRAFSHLLNGFDAGQKQASAIRTPQAPDFLPLNLLRDHLSRPRREPARDGRAGS